MCTFHCQKNKSALENKISSAKNKIHNTIKLENPHLASFHPDFLYHLGLHTSQDLEKLFGDVKFVCMGGTSKRMHEFAIYIMKQINYELPFGTELLDISINSHRYSMFKVGPVLAVSHGMGISSISILLHEMIKLIFYSKCKDPIFFRIGTCGGVGLPGGTVVVSEDAVDGMCNHYYEIPILGKLIQRPCKFDKQITEDLKSLANSSSSYEVLSGTTLCALDFYEGQARLDGAFCEYTQDEKRNYLQKLYNKGIRNIEMESLVFGAMTYQARIRAACVCVCLLDRLKGDQISVAKEIYSEWERRPQEIIGEYIKRILCSEHI